MEVFLVRHGEINHSDPKKGITPAGKIRAKEIGKEIQRQLQTTAGFVFLSSPAIRAIETAEEINKIIQTGYEVSGSINCGSVGKGHKNELIELMRGFYNKNVAVLILVAHAEQVESLFSQYRAEDMISVYRINMGEYIHFSYLP